MTTRQMPAKADEQHGIRPKGYRLPESTHLGRVRLQVADLERSLAFYEKVLGMRVIRRTGDSVSLGPHGEDREIVHLRQLRSARPVPKRGLLGLYHFAILLPDRASLGRFVAHLAEIGVYAGMSDHFVSEAVYLTDPDGLGIEVYADRPRDAWRYDTCISSGSSSSARWLGGLPGRSCAEAALVFLAISWSVSSGRSSAV